MNKKNPKSHHFLVKTLEDMAADGKREKGIEEGALCC